MAQETEAVRELFRRYATGTTTLSQLATWMNGQGLRTRNMKKIADGSGILQGGPRLFTTASVRGILHNPFYYGKVKHLEQFLPGGHASVVPAEWFQTVQSAMKRNSGRFQMAGSIPKSRLNIATPTGIVVDITCARGILMREPS